MHPREAARAHPPKGMESCDWVAAVNTAELDRRFEDSLEFEHAVDYILDDCFFTVGQMVGMRTTVDYDAVVWWRDHFRAKFLAAMLRQGNRWIQDRQNVAAVGWMLAERAVRYAADAQAPSINIDAARKAAVDVERYCQLHAKRRVSALKNGSSDGALPVIAGYWCTPVG
ncbi:MAG: hypothetical protein HYS05_05365 [Acidobacteria bacterium]|nr:hypothetical protein [Acidobacteriota bacterium]